jgi:hypothetical protein
VTELKIGQSLVEEEEEAQLMMMEMMKVMEK